jgi:hypothetical protein
MKAHKYYLWPNASYLCYLQGSWIDQEHMDTPEASGGDSG